MFSGGIDDVGVVGLLPPPHPTNDPITIAIASHFILASKPVVSIGERLIHARAGIWIG
jgi:hypothetical protein